MNQIEQAYGRLQESLNITGYTFERACGHLLWLLEDNRWKKCADGFRDVNAFLQSIQLGQFKAVAEQRKKIAVKIKDLQPKASNRAIAKTLGVGDRTVDRDIAPNGAKEAKKTNNINVGVAPNGATGAGDGARAQQLADRHARKAEAAAQTEERRNQSRAAVVIEDGKELREGDCRQVLVDVKPNSVPLILTDPPYGDDAEPLYRWLAEFAAHVLIPGGSLICYTGQSRLDRDISILSSKLRWWWLLSMMHDQSQRLPGKFVIAGFKPVLWFVKEFRRGRSLVPDVLKPPQRDKELHNWGQGEGGIQPLIEHLTEPGELIVDPFAGTAKWGTICVDMGRRWLGSDIVKGGSTEVVAEVEEDKCHVVLPIAGSAARG